MDFFFLDRDSLELDERRGILCSRATVSATRATRFFGSVLWRAYETNPKNNPRSHYKGTAKQNDQDSERGLDTHGSHFLSGFS